MNNENENVSSKYFCHMKFKFQSRMYINFPRPITTHSTSQKFFNVLVRARFSYSLSVLLPLTVVVSSFLPFYIIFERCSDEHCSTFMWRECDPCEFSLLIRARNSLIQSAVQRSTSNCRASQHPRECSFMINLIFSHFCINLQNVEKIPRRSSELRLWGDILVSFFFFVCENKLWNVMISCFHFYEILCVT